jgi:hypothetical protein
LTTEEFEARRDKISQEIRAESCEKTKQYNLASIAYRELGNMEKTAECLARVPRSGVENERMAKRMGGNAWRAVYREFLEEAVEIYDGLGMNEEAARVYDKIVNVTNWLAE